MISIVIPALNEEKYIGRLLQSLENQTLKDFEVIVVDGSSEDMTRDVVTKFKKAKLVTTKIRNVSHQRNLGAENAKFERLLFLDADGYMEPTFLEDALREISRKNLEVTGCYLYPDSGHPYYRFAYMVFRQWVKFQNKTPTPVINGSCFFTTKKIHKLVNGFDTKINFAEDYDYARKARRHCNIKLLKTPKIYTSVRRFEKEGKLKLAMKYLRIGLEMDIAGNMSPEVKYESGKF